MFGCYVKSWSLKPFLLSPNLVCLFASECVCCLCSCVARASIMTHSAAMKHSFQQMSPSSLLPDSLSKVWVSICAYIRCICNGAYSCHQFLQGSVCVRAVRVCVQEAVWGAEEVTEIQTDSWSQGTEEWASIHLFMSHFISYSLPLHPWPQQWPVCAGSACLLAAPLGANTVCKCVCVLCYACAGEFCL